jgi:hypothetical protein
MKRLIVALIVVLSFANVAFAQRPPKEPPPVVNPGTKNLPPTSHCLAPGTQISLGNQTLSIESLNIGQLILKPLELILVPTGVSVERNRFSAARIREVHRSEHQGKLYLIADSEGHVLSATAGHPIFTTQGAVVASQLQVGDWVQTISGKARIERITIFDYAGLVFNLSLDAGQGAYAHTFFANGILVGDLTMQKTMQ